ncbi:DNA mismatch repair endonuclease MutL [Kroppenstedtia eburnea]|uniref:DNA mismatch repair protein MutL n=1 Tax=Kroppenstedtia eburnea TaxID=714067 RepID=A0A1N7ITM3_9BACL|nr:DNA mismatch repair endonuclease MutL [Kroppenstedtia eburnea]QKI82184.1 DNA mismatch repair endonuclease MutL [Kroppenstedtia eburnea]SIS40366.1 DNA mismatch repair protein MutL [Kroppenstedtia eburnea]
MGEIRLLDDQLANRIAAGEVVERPASVVKELVENALDAGADRIHIEIIEGGIRSIRVSDNGKGMDREDALLAFERHATSKIRRERDLFSIRSLGFRGEALPSIASVSKLTLTTARAEGIGTRLVLEGGKLLSTEDAARSPGTEVSVEELFFNTPARLKYLKTVNTEVSHVADHVGRQALAHPGISFVLMHNGKELFRTPGDGKLLHVAHALYGKQVARKMLPVDAEDMDFKVEGLAAKPEVTRSNRSYISIVVNGRYIRNIPVSQAVLRGYDTLLPIGRYPIVVLSLSMDPKLVDVNVHPAKLEVRLSKEQELCRLIEGGLKALFREHVLIPQAASPRREHHPEPHPVQQRLQWNDDASLRRRKEETWKVRETGATLRSEPEPVSPPAPAAPPAPEPADPGRFPAPPGDEKKTGPIEEPGAEESASGGELPDLTPLTQIHGTYIIAQAEDGFYLMDQHAAHERIYYERFYSRMQEGDGRLQALLMPLTVECTPAEAEVIRQWVPHLSELGMEMEPFGNTAFLVRSHPVWFPKGSEEELLWEVLDWVKRGERVDPARLQDDGAKLMACKAAIKANRHLRREEMESLIQQLRACITPYTCPHGRPILIHFSTYEIEKMFKRVM